MATQNYPPTEEDNRYLRHQTRIRTALMEVGQHISSTLDLEEVIDTLISHTKAIMEVEIVIITLGNRFTKSNKPDLDVDEQVRAKLEHNVQTMYQGYGLVGQAWVSHAPVMTANFLDDPRFQGELYQENRAVAQSFGAKASMAIPLLFSGQPIGVMLIAKNISYEWQTQDVELAQEICNLAAIALNNALLYQQVQAHSSQTEQFARMRASLVETGRQINASLNLNEVLNSLLQNASQLMQADLVRVGILKGRVLHDHSSMPLSEEILTTIQDSVQDAFIGKGLTAKVLQTGQPAWTNNYFHDENLMTDQTAENVRIAKAFGSAAVLIVPILIGNEKVGILTISKKKPYDWQPIDITLAKEIALNASIAIHNANLYGQVQAEIHKVGVRNRELEAVQAFNEQLRDLNELKTTLWQVVKLAQEVTGSAIVSIQMWEEASSEIKLVALYGPPNRHIVDPLASFPTMDVSKIRVLLRDEVTIQVFETGQPVLIEDTSNYQIMPVFTKPQDKVHSVMLHPLTVEGKVVGVLGLRWEGLSRFSNEQVRFAAIVAEQISTALAKVRLSDAREKETQLKTALAMARTVAHELNQQLTIMQGLLDMLSEDEPLDNETRQFMEKAINTMSKQIRQYQRLNQVVIGEMIEGVAFVDMPKSTK